MPACVWVCARATGLGLPSLNYNVPSKFMEEEMSRAPFVFVFTVWQESP
jgi:hypothetical protein